VHAVPLSDHDQLRRRAFLAGALVVDDSVGSIPSTVTLAFSSGPSYTGEGIGATTLGPESYVFTLDANGNDTIEVADRPSGGSAFALRLRAV